MKWPKYLDAYPISVIAQRAGVTERTAKKWRREKQIPKARAEAVRSVKEIYIAPARTRKKILNEIRRGTLSLDDLALLAGVSWRTARKWLMAGEIPVDNRGFLVDPHREKKKRERKLYQPILVIERETPRFFFQRWEWELDEELTDSSLIWLMRLVADFEPNSGRYQFTANALANTERSEGLFVASSVLVDYQFTDDPQTAEVEFFCKLSRDYSTARRYLQDKLLEHIHEALTIKRLSLLISERKERRS